MGTALKDRSDLANRLLEGHPGVVLLGQPVAQGFSYDYHVAKARLLPARGEPIGIGFDFGHTPTAVIGQESRGSIQIFAALTLENAGIRQLLERFVIPWLRRFAPGR